MPQELKPLISAPRRHDRSLTTWRIALILSGAVVTLGCGVGQSSTEQLETSSIAASGEEASPFEGLVFFCTRCKKEVPETMGAGTSCPHCGAFFNSATNADGSTLEADPPSQGMPVRYWGPVVLIVMFGGEYLFRKWRKRNREE